MKHLIEIDDKIPGGKSLLEFLKGLSRSQKYVSIAEMDFPSVNDEELAKEIKKGLRSGRADKNKVLRKLGLK